MFATYRIKIEFLDHVHASNTLSFLNESPTHLVLCAHVRRAYPLKLWSIKIFVRSQNPPGYNGVLRLFSSGKTEAGIRYIIMWNSSSSNPDSQPKLTTFLLQPTENGLKISTKPLGFWGYTFNDLLITGIAAVLGEVQNHDNLTCQKI